MAESDSPEVSSSIFACHVSKLFQARRKLHHLKQELLVASLSHLSPLQAADFLQTPLIELNDSSGEESDIEILTSLSTTSNAETCNSNDVASYFKTLPTNNKQSRKTARENTRKALQRSTQPPTNEASSNDDIDGLVISPTTQSTSSSTTESIDDSFTLATVLDFAS
jgi:hypothetical protein